MDSQMMPTPKAKKQTKDIQIEDEDKPLACYKSEGGFIVEDASEEEENSNVLLTFSWGVWQ